MEPVPKKSSALRPAQDSETSAVLPQTTIDEKAPLLSGTGASTCNIIPIILPLIGKFSLYTAGIS
jgi:hypothetical protein